MFTPRHARSPLALPGRAGIALAAGFLLAVPAEPRAQEPAPPAPPAAAPVPVPAPGATPLAPSPAPATPPAPPASQEAGFLGTAIDDVDEDRAAELGLSEPAGAVITEVVDESPAAEAGLREDDVLLSWDGEAVRGALHLRRLVRETPPGRDVRVTLLRNGERREMDVTVGERSGSVARMRGMDEEARRELESRMAEVRERAREAHEQSLERNLEAREARRRVVRLRSMAGPRIGVRLFSLNDQLAGYFGLDDDAGALVVHVREGSPAEDAGLRAGDVVLSVDGTAVESPADVSRLLRDAAGETVEVEVQRRGEGRTLSVEVPEGPASEALEIGGALEGLGELRGLGQLHRLEGLQGLEGLEGRLRRIAPEMDEVLMRVESPLRDMGPVILRSLDRVKIII